MAILAGLSRLAHHHPVAIAGGSVQEVRGLFSAFI